MKEKIKLLLFLLTVIILIPTNSSAQYDFTSDVECRIANKHDDASADPVNECGTDGTDQGGITYSASGQFGTALDFDGSADNVRFGTSDISGGASVSMCAWINPDIESGTQSIIGADNSASVKRNFQFRINNTDFQFIVFVSNTPHTATDSASVTAAGGWHHVCGTYDAETIQLYVNGSPTDSNGTPSGNMDSDDPVHTIATRVTNSSSFADTDDFNGQIDEVILAKDVWDASQIADIYTYGIDGSQGGGSPKAQVF